MTVITLLTDFGVRDGYPGVMKGVIWKIAPAVKIADISHSIKPQDIFQGALALKRTAQFFPHDTIHIAVVDPGVGTMRRPIGLKLGEQYFIGPDNGLFTYVLEQAENDQLEREIVHLDQKKYWLPEISNVFHGRDIFSPCAAHLALGVPLTSLGSPINDPIRLNIHRPETISGHGLRGHVIEIDTFGNLSTDVEDKDIRSMGDVLINVGGQQINGLVRTFGDRPIGTLIALVGTSHDLMISIVNGNAAEKLKIKLGDPVEINPQAGGHPG